MSRMYLTVQGIQKRPNGPRYVIGVFMCENSPIIKCVIEEECWASLMIFVNMNYGWSLLYIWKLTPNCLYYLLWIMSELWLYNLKLIVGEFWINYAIRIGWTLGWGQIDMHTDRHTETDNITLTQPSLGAGLSENGVVLF